MQVILSICTYIGGNIEPDIQKNLKNFPAVAILGSRQCGKSTLAERIVSSRKKSVYLDLELESDPDASDETILDRFELDIGRGITKSGEQTVESSFRLSSELTGTGRIYYLTGEKDKYDFFNYGLKVVFRLE